MRRFFVLLALVSAAPALAALLPIDEVQTPKIVKLGQRSEVAVPLTTNFDRKTGFRPGGTDADTRKVQVDAEVYSNEATDYRTYAPGLRGWSAVEQTAALLEKHGSALRVVARATDLLAGSRAFQVVCNEVIGPADTPMLATFILPPHWQMTGRYPIVLTGNGYTISNNTRLFRDAGPTDVFQLAGMVAQGNHTGALVVLVNCGGTEASGLQASAVANIGRVIDRAAELGGDRQRVICWGGSRGGLTALVWGANPLDLNYTPIAIFARVPFPTIADTALAPLSACPQVMEAYHAVYGPDGWRYRVHSDIGRGDRSDLCRRVTGYADRSEANAHSGLGYVDKLAAAHKAGKLRFVVTSFGTKDGWELYAPGQIYHQALEARGVPITTYIGLGGGHEGAPDRLEKDLVAFVRACALPQPEPWSPKPGRFYAVQEDRGQGGRVRWVEPKSTPFSARVPFREQAGRPALIELVGAAGGEYQVTLSQAGKPIKTWTGKFAASEVFVDCFDIPPVGKYEWSFLWQGKPITRTPTQTPEGREPPLTLTATVEQPDMEDYFVHPKLRRAFGVDEVNPEWGAR